MRATDRVLSFLLGLALAAAGVLTLVNIVLAERGMSWWPHALWAWARRLTTTPRNDMAFQVTAAVVLAAGILLLVSQLRPWAPADLPVAGGEGTWKIRRRSAEHHLASSAGAIPGTYATDARVRTTKNRWDALVTVDAQSDQQSQIEDAVRAAMTAIGAPEGSTSRVRLHRRRRTH
jgi:hypothetical protein